MSRLMLACLCVQVEYWMEQLCGMPRLQLPTDIPRKAGHGCSRGGWLDIDVPEEVVRGVESFAARSGATLYMVLLSSLQLLLAARSRQDDIVVSHPCLAPQNMLASHDSLQQRSCCYTGRTLPDSLQ